MPAPVNDESYFDFHSVFFSMDEPVMVEVEFSPGLSYASIHPLRHGIRPKIDGNTISFPMLRSHKLVIKVSGSLPLALCATPLEENVPTSGDPGVIYFGPGTHEPGVIQPVYTLQTSSDLGITDPFAELLNITGSGPSTELLFHDPDAAK